MFNRRDVPLDGSALLDDVIVSELAARRPAPITDTAVGLLAALVAAVDSRTIPDLRGAYDWVLDVAVAEPPPPPAGRVARTPLPDPQLAEPGPPPVGQLVIRRTWDGPRHRRNGPVRRRVTGSVAVITVVASTLGVSGVAAAVTGDPFRPFHSVVARVWHGVAGQPRTTDAREGSHANSHARSVTRVATKHLHASAAPMGTHLRSVQTAGPHYSWTDVHGQGGTSIGPYVPGGVSYPTLPGLPVSPGGDGTVVGRPVNGPGGSSPGSQPGHPSGPVWLPSIGFPTGGITPSQPLPTVQAPTP
ncbi:MAG: hypothetical protein ABJA86_13665 [Nocardioidaceae bacterium]